MPVARKPRRITPGTSCLEGGTSHAWEPLGLDIRRDKLVDVKACVWCHTERTECR